MRYQSVTSGHKVNELLRIMKIDLNLFNLKSYPDGRKLETYDWIPYRGL